MENNIFNFVYLLNHSVTQQPNTFQITIRSNEKTFG